MNISTTRKHSCYKHWSLAFSHGHSTEYILENISITVASAVFWCCWI